MPKRANFAVDRRFREALLRLQRWNCAYCRTRFELGELGVVLYGPRVPTIDHVYPWSLGGRHKWNRVLACQGCNGRKGDRPPTGCELVALQWVNAVLAASQGQTPPVRPPALGLLRQARQWSKGKRKKTAQGSLPRPPSVPA